MVPTESERANMKRRVELKEEEHDTTAPPLKMSADQAADNYCKKPNFLLGPPDPPAAGAKPAADGQRRPSVGASSPTSCFQFANGL